MQRCSFHHVLMCSLVCLLEINEQFSKYAYFVWFHPSLGECASDHDGRGAGVCDPVIHDRETAF